MQFRNEVTRRPIGTRGRIALTQVMPTLLPLDFCAYGLSPFITTYAQYRG
ncbi:bifunctional glutamine-synthetase adenylyltransferase/deadenyltransferase [Pasteurella multocida subsp. multocida str. Anand1_cattle]|nr:bifunctional glutamine-synthetase adenylyltransferase/deadenyltransferase [Pasteurella multocida subsp. multocida str. Anand1_cattle]